MHRRTSRAICAATAILTTPSLARDYACSDFSTWRQAQRFYKTHGGPRHDPHRLDADQDGIACEALR